MIFSRYAITRLPSSSRNKIIIRHENVRHKTKPPQRYCPILTWVSPAIIRVFFSIVDFFNYPEHGNQTTRQIGHFMFGIIEYRYEIYNSSPDCCFPHAIDVRQQKFPHKNYDTKLSIILCLNIVYSILIVVSIYQFQFRIPY